MTTIEKLLALYEGRFRLSPPPEFRHVYGKRSQRIAWIVTKLTENTPCSMESAYILCYQLVMYKDRWRKAKRLILAYQREVEVNHVSEKAAYENLHMSLTSLIEESPETPQ
jgi:hypothetical protein